MLELRDIKKVYKIGEIETIALDGISVSFRQKEFVSILGQSGSGKTTCLNVIGGLDRYDSGNLIINGKETKNFKPHDWDAYRNNSIGFVFQSYNLITHLSIVANVELSMTLSGVSSSEKKKRALEVLEQVGLKDHLHKKPNQLSGGQMQRVAIARALANDPDILLCDEPTGALDTTTSIQIMELIKEVSKDKLVIMVTHNPELAERYSDRVIQFQDGKIIKDTKPHIEKPKDDQFNLVKTSMSFLTALKLSANNIKTKLGRTFLTSFASSIGIIGIALILSLSVGFDRQIDMFQSDTLSEFPITIMQQPIPLERMYNREGEETEFEEYPDDKELFLYDKSLSTSLHINKFTDEYIEYINNIDVKTAKSIGYIRSTNFNLLADGENGILPVNMKNINHMPYPELLDTETSSKSFLETNYDVIAGSIPKSYDEILLVVDSKNRMDINTASTLGYITKDASSIKFEEILGKEIKIVKNNDFYVKTEFGNYTFDSNYKTLYENDENITLKVVGIIRQKEDADLPILPAGITYSEKLVEKVVEINKESDIVKEQVASDKNVLSLEVVDEEAKKSLITYLGGDLMPAMITIYPYDFESKDKILDYLDEYNEDKEEKQQIKYTDLADSITSLTGSIMDGITMVLIAFAATALVVSLIMISILIYTSVLERTKEIGILKALGARKKDITRVFDAETFILGVSSGVLGIIISLLLIIPINSIIYNATELKDVAYLRIDHAVILVCLSTILTMLGGHIPAKMAAKKDAVEALRSE